MRLRVLQWAMIAALAGAPGGLAQRARSRPVGPGNGIERLEKMTPEERERALAKLPPERRRRLEERLRRWEELPPEERQRLRRRFETFQQLPPEQQARARRLYRQFQNLDGSRKPLIRSEFLRLREMDESQRRTRFASPEFRERYSRPERDLLEGLAELPPSP